jgi:hypothetical protein
VSDDKDSSDEAEVKGRLSWDDKRVWIPALVAVMTAAIGAVVYCWPQLSKWAEGSNAPAWVQAVGSVIAIFVAVLVPYAQSRREHGRREHEEFQRRLRNMAAVHALVSYARFALKELDKDLESPQANKKALTHEVTVVRQYLERFPLIAVENARVVGRFVGIFEGVASLEAAMLNDSENAKSIVRELRKLIARFNSDFRSAHAELLGMMFLPEYREDY